MEDSYLWEDDDHRFTVEKVPLYDSAEDELSPNHDKFEFPSAHNQTEGTNGHSDLGLSSDTAVASSSSTLIAKIEPVSVALSNPETGQEMDLHPKDTAQLSKPQKNAIIPHRQGSDPSKNKPGSIPRKRLKLVGSKKSKLSAENQVDAKLIVQSLSSKEAQQEVLMHEDIKIDAASELNAIYNKIRPAIEAHERDNQDSLPISLAEEWSEAKCAKFQADFDLYGSIIKNLITSSLPPSSESKLVQAGDNGKQTKFLTY